MPPKSINYIPLLMGAYLAWRIYRRCRQHLGRQPLKTPRIIWWIFFYCLLSGGFALMSLSGSGLLTGWLLGVLTGLPIAWYGLYLTHFECVPEGRFFTPNPWLNLTMAMTFIGRLVYRMMTMNGVSLINWKYTGVLQTPLSVYVFETVSSFFAVYYIGVLVRCHAKPLAAAEAETQPETQ